MLTYNIMLHSSDLKVQYVVFFKGLCDYYVAAFPPVSASKCSASFILAVKLLCFTTVVTIIKQEVGQWWTLLLTSSNNKMFVKLPYT